MFSILDDRNTTFAEVEAAVSKGLIHPAAAAEWRLGRLTEVLWPAPPPKPLLHRFWDWLSQI